MAAEERKLRRTAADWDERYQARDTPWDTGLVDPALRDLVEASLRPMATGNMPAISAMLVIKMGRKRTRPASNIAE